MTNRIYVQTLGCPKATVDSETLLTSLARAGYQLADRTDEADLTVVNTCGFIDAAIDQSLAAIGEALRQQPRVIVTGCLGKRADFVRKHYPDVLAVTGPQAADDVVALIHRHLPQDSAANEAAQNQPALRLTPRHYAYLKISEGCNHRCSFCIIPSLRGPLHSRSPSDILRQAERLASEGVKELLVVSQDTSAYGVDRRYRTDFWQGRPVKGNLEQLCRELGRLGIWIRLHYIYPYPSVDALLPLMQDGLILPYLDIPLQHASPGILQAMRRPAAGEPLLERIERWRSACPDLVLRSTFITGFPGESEADFEALLTFLEQASLDRVGAFAYSPVDGASANALAPLLPLAVREERRDTLLAWQADISRERLRRRLDQRVTVVIDEVDDGEAFTRSYGEAPEIDGHIVVATANQRVKPGDRLDVVIVDCEDHDLYADVVAT